MNWQRYSQWTALQPGYNAHCIDILLVHTLTTSDHIWILIRAGMHIRGIINTISIRLWKNSVLHTAALFHLQISWTTRFNGEVVPKGDLCQIIVIVISRQPWVCLASGMSDLDPTNTSYSSLKVSFTPCFAQFVPLDCTRSTLQHEWYINANAIIIVQMEDRHVPRSKQGTVLS